MGFVQGPRSRRTRAAEWLLLCAPPQHGLRLEELLEAELAPLAAVARLLVAAERRAEIGLGAVHADLSGADPRRDAARALEVARRDIARESVGGVVCDPDRVLIVLVGQDREHRPEDLLARDRHVVAHVRENGRPHVVAAREAGGAAPAASHERGALVDPLLDQALDLGPLRLAHHGTDPP